MGLSPLRDRAAERALEGRTLDPAGIAPALAAVETASGLDPTGAHRPQEAFVAGFARAARIVEGRHEMSPIERAPVETNGAIAAPAIDGRVVAHTSTQALFFSLGAAAKLLKPPSNRPRFVGGTVGGGFGGKGPGEMCANPVPPAVANAIFDAARVDMDSLPIAPDKVLRAQGGARPQGRR